MAVAVLQPDALVVETSGEASQGPSVAIIGVGVNFRLGEIAVDRIDQPVIDVARCSPAVPSLTIRPCSST